MVENYSNDYDVKCKLDACKTYPAITDSERGEIVCGGCGLSYCKICRRIISKQWLHSEDFMRLRIGPATSLTMYDKGLSTVIGE